MKNYNLNTLTSIGVHYQRQSVFSILSHCSDTYQRAQNHKTLGPSTSHRLSTIATITLGLLVVLLGGLFFSHSAYAGTSISIASGSSGNNNVISFGNVKPSSSGSVVTASDELTITTDCAAGSNVYISATNNSTTNTNLVNNAGSSNNTIATLSGTTIGTTALPLENNTWGFNTDNSATSSGANNGNGVYYGLPAYANATDHAIYSGTNTTVPIYYGAKVTNSLVPGKYIGQVLYTATINSSCLNYTVIFNKNANDATGTMNNQTIPPATSTPLATNGFSRSGYVFLGWSTSPDGRTGTASNGIGTFADVDYTNGQSVTDLGAGGENITLYAIWGQTMQSWAGNLGCSTLSENQTITLSDARDNSEYSIKKFSDGSCWMISNLKLGYDKGYALTNELTNIQDSDTSTYYLPQAGYQGTISSDSGRTTANFTDPSDDQARVQYASASDLLVQSSSLANAQDTGYYNFYAATLGKSYYGLNGNVSGYVERDICPKGWQLPVNDSSNHRSWYYFYNTLNGGQHANLMSASGASLLYSGNYYDSSLRNVGSYGYWWSSTVYHTNGSYYLVVYSNGNVNPQSYNSKYAGFAVRCVAKTSASGYMQNFNASTSLPNVGDQTTLMDSRDGKEYTVKRLPDGKVWMTQNLTLNGVELTSDDTNFTSGGPYYIPKDGGAGSLTDSSTKNATTGYNFTSGSDNQAMFKFRAKNSSYTNDSDTGYYNFYTATLGFSYYKDGKTSGSSTQDICPKGWRLPWVSDSGTTASTSGDFVTLAKSYNSSASWTNSNTAYNYYTQDSTIHTGIHNGVAANNNYAGFSYSGGYNGTSPSNVGSDGSYWSSSVYDTYVGYYLVFDSSSVYPQSGNSKYYGLAVRCVAK